MNIKRLAEYQNKWYQIIKSRVPDFKVNEDEGIFEAIIKMRRKLFESQDLSKYTNINRIDLKILEDIFLKPTSEYDLKCIKEFNLTLQELLNIHRKRKNIRLPSIFAFDEDSEWFKEMCRD